MAHVAGHKLIGTVVVGVQHGNVLSDQKRARLQAHIDDQLGGRGAEHHGREPEEGGPHAPAGCCSCTVRAALGALV